MRFVLVNSERLGELEVDENSMLEFPTGILGFPDHHHFAMVSADADGLYSWLQAADDPKLTFLTVVPTPFFPAFEPNVPDEECEMIGLTAPDDAQVLCIVSAAPSGITANLLGPIVLNVRTRMAKQVVLTDPGLSTRTPLVPA